MGREMSDPAGPDRSGRRPAYGPAVWGWGLLSGLVLWGLGFLLLPWWVALFLWWWPSVITGAVAGIGAISLAKWIGRTRTGVARSPQATAGR